jgi:two-component system, OmpR family, response regulator RegX3
MPREGVQYAELTGNPDPMAPTQPSSILVVDDEDAIREALAYSLQAEGYRVASRSDGRSALDAVASEPFDLVVLDVMLGDLSGIEVCRQIRSSADVPILMLTARDAEADVVLGLEAGADDYVTKPFSMREVVSRTRAMLRRRELDRSGGERMLHAGDVEIDLLRHEVWVDGRLARVTPTEFRLLALLAGSDRAFGRREILEHVWQTPFVPDERSCDVHIANVRRKVEEDHTRPKRLITVRGVGYRLVR